jgi:hypothetical protein
MLTVAMLTAASAMHESVRATTLGLDFAGGTIQSTLGSGTFGFRFSISSAQIVSGLGFWDYSGGYPQTQVGLWDSSGTLVASVDTATSTVHSFAANAFGSWQFMDVSLNLPAGDYTVGASYNHGQSSEAVYNPSISTNIITYLGSAWIQSSPIFQFPPSKGSIPYIGGNIEFNLTTPLPGALPLFAGGASMLGFLGWRRKKRKTTLTT